MLKYLFYVEYLRYRKGAASVFTTTLRYTNIRE